MIKDFEQIAHTADLKIRAFGATLPELFSNTLKGMFISIKPYSEQVSYRDDSALITRFTSERTMHIRSIDLSSLLVDFLSECLTLSDIYNEAYFDTRFTQFKDTELEATVYGVTITGFEVVEIKAVTYHDLSIEYIDDQWVATIVFDI